MRPSSRSDRADLHRRVAAAIEQQNPGSLDEKSALIAEHMEAAGDLHAAFDWHMRAGAWSNNRDVAAARVSWDRARQVADALPDDDPDRTTMRIAPRTILCATGWRVHADDSHVRFEELRELCALAGDKTPLAIGIAGPIQVHYERGEIQQASQMASEQLALLESIGDPSLTAQAGFSAMGIKAQVGELVEALRWSQATIDWAGGDLTKGGLIIGSPLAWAKLVRGTAGWWFGRRGWREDLDEAFAMAESADSMTLACVLSWTCIGMMNGVLPASDAAVERIEKTLRIVEASGDDYAVAMIKNSLGLALLWRGDAADGDRALEMVAQVRDVSLHQQYPRMELALNDLIAARERAKRGHRDSAIPVMRKSVDEILTGGHLLYGIPMTGVFVETLLDRAHGGRRRRSRSGDRPTGGRAC